MFRRIRIAVLLLVLVHVGVGAWLLRARAAAWNQTLRVAVYPIAADDSPRTTAYVDALEPSVVAPIEQFLVEEAKRYGVPFYDPVDVRLVPRLNAIPPPPPHGGSRLDILWWSLQLRYWVWHHGDVAGPAPHVRLFVLYHDPEVTPTVPHSVGLPQGLIGVVHVFATRTQAAENAVVMTHELLHTLRATDKYDPVTNQPVFPDGYAEPRRNPREPQEFAEIMAGRIPVSRATADMPRGLEYTLIGEMTAREIGWRP